MFDKKKDTLIVDQQEVANLTETANVLNDFIQGLNFQLEALAEKKRDLHAKKEAYGLLELNVTNAETILNKILKALEP